MTELDYLTPNMTHLKRVDLLPTPDPLAIARAWVADTCLVLAQGSYFMHELKLPTGKFAMVAPSGASITFVGRDKQPISYMISEDHGLLEFYLHGIEFNCNWDGQTEARRLNRGNFKLGAVCVRTWRGKIDSCTVKHFGCDGKSLPIGNEVFPLRLETYTGGKPTEHYPAWASSLKTEPTPCIQITKCSVTDPHFVDGGYCTAIFVKTSQPNAGDRLPLGVRTTRAAAVTLNRVVVPGGIAYGCAQSDDVFFEGNRCKDTKCAFNFDTGDLRNSRICDNAFFNVSQGINLEGSSNNVKIEGNTIEVGKPFFNPVTGLDEISYAVRLNHNTDTTLRWNTFKTDFDKPIIGYAKLINNTTMRRKPVPVEPAAQPEPVVSTAELDALKSRNADLTETCKELTGKLTEARGRQDDLARQLRETDKVNEDLLRRLNEAEVGSKELLSVLKAHDSLHAEHVKLLDLTANLKESLREFLGL